MLNCFRHKQNIIKLKLLGCIIISSGLNIIGYLFILIPAGFLLSCLVMRLIIKHQIRVRALLPILFMAITIALIQVFTHGSQVLYLWQIPGNTFVVYKEGLQAGILIFLKIISSTSLLLLFFRSLKLSEFLTALKELGLPKAFIEVSVMAVKYIFIFKDELANITKAQKARLGYRNLPHSLISMGNAGGILLDQAFAKSEELAKALKCRGYDGSSLIK